MDPSSYLLIFFIVLLIVFSAYFESAESALSSMNKIRIKKYADDGDKRAKRALKLEANYERTITVLLIGNNIVIIAKMMNKYMSNKYVQWAFGGLRPAVTGLIEVVGTLIG